MSSRYRFFGMAFEALALSGADRLLRPWVQGRGAILTMHHVRPWQDRGGFAPNRLLEITPAFLDQALARARAAGFAFVTLDEALDRLAREDDGLFLSLTFDDGYRDNLVHALPVLERHGAPATIFATPGFAERSAELWWVDLEEVVRANPWLEVDLGSGPRLLDCATPQAKQAAFETLYADLRGGPEPRLRAVIADLARRSDVSSAAIAEELCLDWDGLAELARHPLVTLGAHTMTHPMLARHEADFARTEMAQSRSAIEARLGVEVRHIAYPVGDPGSAGPREFAMARELGFRAGVTTRPGMLFAEHADHATALPRLSLNGHFQTLRQLDVLLAGVPSFLWNRGRRLSVA